MRVLVFGAGATGSVYAAQLAHAGHSVTATARGEHVRAIREGGLQVDGLDGGPFRFEVLEELPDDVRFDRVLLTVKTGDIESSARSIGQHFRHPAPVLALQNGLGIRARVVRALRANGWAYAERWVSRGIQIIGATFVGPGHVRLAGKGEVLLPASQQGVGPNGFDALLAHGGIAVRTVESIDREEWRKALINAAMNPVTADHRVENRRLAEEPWRGQALALLEEARSVAEAEGFAFPREEAEAELVRIVRISGTNRSSMLQDLDAGRPTEIDSISGEILRRGTRHGLELPQTRRIVERIERKARERAARFPATSAGPRGPTS